MHLSLIMLLLVATILFVVLTKGLVSLLWAEEATNFSWVRNTLRTVRSGWQLVTAAGREFWQQEGTANVVLLLALVGGLALLCWPFSEETKVTSVGVTEVGQTVLLLLVGLGIVIGALRYAGTLHDERRAAERRQFAQQHEEWNQEILRLFQEELARSHRRAAQQQARREAAEQAAAAAPAWALVLEISTSASEQEIQRAYRTLAKKHHPDSGGSDALMQQLNQARDQALTWLRVRKPGSSGEEKGG